MLLFYLSLLDTDEEASLLTNIYNEHRGLMLYIARSILKRQDLAEDAVHDAMLKIIDWIKAHHESDPQKIKSFVCLVTRRTALNNRKYEQRRRTVSLDELTNEPAILDSYEESADSDLLAALSGLPYHYQEILQLTVQHELSAKEAAKILGISQANAHKRLQRARQALRAQWREQHDDTK